MISIATKPGDGLEAWYDGLAAAADHMSEPGGGLGMRLAAGLEQLDRFISANIEVDTGRTVLSLNRRLVSEGASLVGYLGTPVSYAPYVRDASHREPFYRYAERVELPGIVRAIGRGVVAMVESEF